MIPLHYLARLGLRAARARYVDVRPFKHSDPQAYLAARHEYLVCIVETQIALSLRPRIPQSPMSRNLYT